jgi:uncharacterized membrane protein YphA (DoxX/SURF4 family)
MKTFLSSKTFRFIWSAALAVLLWFICPPCFSKTTLTIILGVLLVIINAAEFIARWAWLTHAARILVGCLFIFSGFIKANDPLGFSYKLEEYFQVFGADTGWKTFFEGFEHMALPLAVIICASEIILGVMLLLGYRRNLTLWLLFAQIAFFTFLTFYSACYNKVTHCGCFGDFLPLKPWESFWKDVALMILITLLFAGRENIRPVFPPMAVSALFMLAFVFAVAFPIYALRNLPPMDFRAYAPGLSIKENMKFGENYQPAKYESVLVYENIKTGELKEMKNDEYMASKIWEDTLNWKWHATDNKLINEAQNAPRITDFTASDERGDNITDSLLNDKEYSFWLVMHELKKTYQDEELMAMINDFYKLASQDGYNFIAMSASSASEIDEFKHRHNALYDFATVDNTVLKTMIRSNPGLMLIKDGKVIANWHYNNFPVYSDVKSRLMK